MTTFIIWPWIVADITRALIDFERDIQRKCPLATNGLCKLQGLEIWRKMSIDRGVLFAF